MTRPRFAGTTCALTMAALLVTMNEVTLYASVKAEPVSGGLRMDITGAGRTEQAIRTMAEPHANELDQRRPPLAAPSGDGQGRGDLGPRPLNPNISPPSLQRPQREV